MSEKKFRELTFYSRQAPEPSITYEMSECSPELFTTEGKWTMVEKVALDEANKRIAELEIDQRLIMESVERQRDLNDRLSAKLETERERLSRAIEALEYYAQYPESQKMWNEFIADKDGGDKARETLEELAKPEDK